MKEEFVEYESVLKCFKSYRFSSFFKKNMSSNTWSNKIDCNKELCLNELNGNCNDYTCEFQHFRDMELNGMYCLNSFILLSFINCSVFFLWFAASEIIAEVAKCYPQGGQKEIKEYKEDLKNLLIKNKQNDFDMIIHDILKLRKNKMKPDEFLDWFHINKVNKVKRKRKRDDMKSSQ